MLVLDGTKDRCADTGPPRLPPIRGESPDLQDPSLDDESKEPVVTHAAISGTKTMTGDTVHDPAGMRARVERKLTVRPLFRLRSSPS